MFDIGWTELMLIGIVALIVIGPKDLPEMFRTLGRFTAKAKGMAREFSRAMESAADEAGVKDVASDLRKATSAKSMGLDAVKSAASKFESWDPMKPGKSVGPKPDPDAPKPQAPAPKGPATQALADAQAAKRVERAAPTPATPAETPSPKPAAKAAAKPKPAAKPKAAAAPKAPAKAAAKPAAKPAAKKPAAKKPSPKKSDA
ncbi:MAG: Sec-independent protein translocase protein TatB [Pseudorhodobacter sp.]